MKEKITPYLRRLALSEGIRQQYFLSDNDCGKEESYNDPLMEDEHEVVKGLVHKYGNRALIKVSYQCAAHCRFCTRIRQIGRPEGTLSEADITPIIQYLESHPEIDDVILSGGDPLYTPKLTYSLLQQLRSISSIKIFRIGTRLPLQSPVSFESPVMHSLLDLIDEMGRERPFFLLLHVEHPDELTPEAEVAIAKLRALKVTLLSQTVFLRGINISFEILQALFNRLYHLGVLPYYLYHCDAVKGLEHFAGDIAEETEIATQLRSSLSGIACPTYVLDAAEGFGKLPVPLSFMEDGKVVRDFVGVGALK